jgi:hypothetical protein
MIERLATIIWRSLERLPGLLPMRRVVKEFE